MRTWSPVSGCYSGLTGPRSLSLEWNVYLSTTYRENRHNGTYNGRGSPCPLWPQRRAWGNALDGQVFVFWIFILRLPSSFGLSNYFTDFDIFGFWSMVIFSVVFNWQLPLLSYAINAGLRFVTNWLDVDFFGFCELGYCCCLSFYTLAAILM